MSKQPTEKLCPSCNTILAVSEFERLDYKGEPRIHIYCNLCKDYERIRANYQQGRVNSLIKSLTVKKPQIKPVWMVVYESFP